MIQTPKHRLAMQLSLNGYSNWKEIALLANLLMVLSVNCANDRVLEVTLNGVPSDTVKVSFSMVVDGKYAEVSVGDNLFRGHFNFTLPFEANGQIRLNAVAFNSECSIGAAQGAVFPSEVNPTTLSMKINACTNCWCSYCLDDTCSISSNDLNDVWGTSVSQIWAVGDSGTMLRWNGVFWMQETPLTALHLESIAARNPTDVWIAGQSKDPPEYGVLLHSNENHWSQEMAPQKMLYSATFSPSGELWLSGGCGEGKCEFIAVRQPGGQIVEMPFPAGLEASAIKEIFHDTAGGIWAIGGIGTLDPKDPLKRCPPNIPMVGRIFSMNSHEGWKSWALPQEKQLCNLTSMWGFDDKDLWVVGEYGAILHWDGQIWTSARDPNLPQRSLWSIWGAHPNDIWAVGGSGGKGLMLHWDGTSWSNVDAGKVLESHKLFEVWGASKNDVWAVGSAGTILRYQRLQGGDDPNTPDSSVF